jgi:hypothetical protein
MPSKYTEISLGNSSIYSGIINFKIHYEILTDFLLILVEFGILLAKQGEIRTRHLVWRFFIEWNWWALGILELYFSTMASSTFQCWIIIPFLSFNGKNGIS